MDRLQRHSLRRRCRKLPQPQLLALAKGIPRLGGAGVRVEVPGEALEAWREQHRRLRLVVGERVREVVLRQREHPQLREARCVGQVARGGGGGQGAERQAFERVLVGGEPGADHGGGDAVAPGWPALEAEVPEVRGPADQGGGAVGVFLVVGEHEGGEGGGAGLRAIKKGFG